MKDELNEAERCPLRHDDPPPQHALPARPEGRLRPPGARREVRTRCEPHQPAADRAGEGLRNHGNLRGAERAAGSRRLRGAGRCQELLWPGNPRPAQEAPQERAGGGGLDAVHCRCALPLLPRPAPL